METSPCQCVCVCVCGLHCRLRNVGIKYAVLTDSCTAVAFLTCHTRTQACWRLWRRSEKKCIEKKKLTVKIAHAWLTEGEGDTLEHQQCWGLFLQVLEVKINLCNKMWQKLKKKNRTKKTFSLTFLVMGGLNQSHTAHFNSVLRDTALIKSMTHFTLKCVSKLLNYLARSPPIIASLSPRVWGVRCYF